MVNIIIKYSSTLLQKVSDSGFFPSLLKRYHKKRYKTSGMGSVSSCHVPGLNSECSFDFGVKNRDVAERSEWTSSKSSTETNSSNSDKSPRYEVRRRKNCKKKAVINDKQAYNTERGHITRRKKGVCTQQNWNERFEAMNSTRGSSQARYFIPTEEHRSPLIKQKSVMSYDSGFPEDERINTLKRSLPDTRGNHHKWLSLGKSHRPYHSQYDEGYSARNLPKHQVDRAPLKADNSSDDEVFFKTKDCFTYEDSSGDDSTVYSYTLRPRKKRNRLKLPKYSVQGDGAYSRYHPDAHSAQLTYQAIASYQASTDGTIDLYEGDKVHVIRKSRGGWWLVQIEEEVGWAPSNYLEPIARCK